MATKEKNCICVLLLKSWTWTEYNWGKYNLWPSGQHLLLASQAKTYYNFSWSQQEMIKTRLVSSVISSHKQNICQAWGSAMTAQKLSMEMDARMQLVSCTIQLPPQPRTSFAPFTLTSKSIAVFLELLGTSQEPDKPIFTVTRSYKVIKWIYSLFFSKA